ncbi:MAG: hypothetical protein OXN27_06580 [Candidatus Poribacteria bacterium]|nr:hypothetical protein [Candidatus Poribacteria bacterium]
MSLFQIMLFTVVLLLSLFSFYSCTEKTQETLTPEETLTLEETETFGLTEEAEAQRATELLKWASIHRYAPECMVQIYSENDTIPPPTPVPIQKEKFAELSQLRQLFQGTALENNFRILRILIDSQIYREYLRQTFDREPHFETLDEFWRMTMPPIPTEQYRPLFGGFLENPESSDFAYLHKIVLEGKGSLTIYNGLAMFCAREPGDPPNIPKIPQPQHLIDGPFIDTPLYEFTKDTVEKWIFHNGHGIDAYKVFENRYKEFIKNAGEADKKKVRGFFNTYGIDDGLIMLALQEPDLTGLILWYSFDEAMFIAWVNHF